MTATHNLITLNLELDIARAQFRILKTPALRREVRNLEREIAQLQAARDIAQPKRSHRRRGTKCAGLIG